MIATLTSFGGISNNALDLQNRPALDIDDDGDLKRFVRLCLRDSWRNPYHDV